MTQIEIYSFCGSQTLLYSDSPGNLLITEIPKAHMQKSLFAGSLAQSLDFCNFIHFFGILIDTQGNTEFR